MLSQDQLLIRDRLPVTTRRVSHFLTNHLTAQMRAIGQAVQQEPVAIPRGSPLKGVHINGIHKRRLENQRRRDLKLSVLRNARLHLNDLS